MSPARQEAGARKFGNQYLNNLGGKLFCLCGNWKGNTVLVGRLGRD